MLSTAMSSRAEEETPALSWTHPGLSLSRAPQPLTPPPAMRIKGLMGGARLQQVSEVFGSQALLSSSRCGRRAGGTPI